MRSPVSPLHYLDYRLYLSEMSRERSQSEAGFSQRAFLQKAGVKSPSLFKQVVDGERNLTADTTEKFIVALGLKGDEAEFFRHLVGFTQAKTSRVKQRHYSQMVELSLSHSTVIVGAQHYQFYSEWWLPVLREVAPLRRWKEDWKGLGQAVLPPITARQAKAGIATLLQLKLLRATPRGWEQTSTTLSTGHRISSMVVRSFHAQMLERASEALEQLPRQQRHISGITLGLSAAGYRAVEREIQLVQERILKIAAADRGPKTEVLQLMQALFPLAKLPPSSKGAPR